VRGKLLTVMAEVPGASLVELAKRANWSTKDGQPNKSLVQRLINDLCRAKKVKKESGRWVLTKAGKVIVKEAGGREMEDEANFPF
jgi:hypothetical protein